MRSLVRFSAGSGVCFCENFSDFGEARAESGLCRFASGVIGSVSKAGLFLGLGVFCFRSDDFGVGTFVAFNILSGVEGDRVGSLLISPVFCFEGLGEAGSLLVEMLMLLRDFFISLLSKAPNICSRASSSVIKVESDAFPKIDSRRSNNSLSGIASVEGELDCLCLSAYPRCLHYLRNLVLPWSALVSFSG